MSSLFYDENPSNIQDLIKGEQLAREHTILLLKSIKPFIYYMYFKESARDPIPLEIMPHPLLYPFSC